MNLTDLLPGIALVTTMGAAIALLLVLTSMRFEDNQSEIVQQIDKLLPQTQCAQCGFPGCRPYAVAIADGEAINHCPPGGKRTIRELADLLGRDILPLDESFGKTEPARVASIRENECIGCTLCIQACPVDAIIGARQQMHSVINSLCTGCDLCVAPCPVDCIDMVRLNHPATVTTISPAATNCIRCGMCETQCPQELAPQELLWQRDSNQAMEILRLESCIECQICDRTCPANIPLTQFFVDTKNRIRSEQQQTEQAAHAQTRYSRRNSRLESSGLITRASESDRADILDRLRSPK